jgi:hypothetical protein
MSLKTIQQAFFDTVYDNDSTALQMLIKSKPTFTASMRAYVYCNNTHESLKETLSNTYPVCEALVGKAYFAQLAAHHVKHVASITRNLNLYGETFSQTLTDLVASREELQTLCYLPAVAQLEWLLHRAYYAKDRNAFDFNALAALSLKQQASLCFTLADDIHLMATSLAALAIWRAHQDSDDKKGIECSLEHVSPKHFFIVIKRDHFLPDAVLVDENIYVLLTAIEAGKTIVELTELAKDASSMLNDLIAKQWIASFYIL